MASESGFFSSSSQVAIFGGNFIQQNVREQDDLNNYLWLLYKEVSPNAILNSGGRLDPVRCYPGTREEVIARIDYWMTSGHTSDRRIFWLSGPAGAGKSAISQTVAELWIERKVPVANFFFFRADSSRCDARPVVATLLYQISSLYPGMKDIIYSVLRSDPVVLRQSMHTKFRRLIQEPVISDRQRYHPSQPPIVLLIDGLDECESAKEDQRTLLHILHSLVTPPNSPFIALVSSRPEPHLVMAFNEIGTFHDSIFLDATYRPVADLQRFIEGELGSIKRTHHLGHSLEQDWPSQTIINTIVTKSSGQFVYAATVLRFIRNSTASPAFSADAVLGLCTVAKVSPFAEIDAIYTHIVGQVENWDAVRDILATYRMLDSYSTPRKLVAAISGCRPINLDAEASVLSALGYRWSDVQSCLSDLTSLFQFKTGVYYSRLVFYHASLNDFLYDKTRAGGLYIDLNFVACRVVASLFREYLEMSTDILLLVLQILRYVTDPSDELNKTLETVKSLHYSRGHIFRLINPELAFAFLERLDKLACYALQSTYMLLTPSRDIKTQNRFAQAFLEIDNFSAPGKALIQIMCI